MKLPFDELSGSYFQSLNELDILLYSLLLLALAIETYTDIRTREVPDWINYSLIAVGIGSRSIESLVFWDIGPIVHSLLGLLAMYIVAVLMFYTGQWGGGDAKLLIGIGAVIGLELKFPSMLLGFLINIVIFGAAYGLIATAYIISKNFRKFRREFSRQYMEKTSTMVRKAAYLTIATMAILFLVFPQVLVDSVSIRLMLIVAIVAIIFSYYLWLTIRSVETACMQKMIPIENVTEGDWIVREIKIDGKYICGPKDLGISKSQIRKLKKLKEVGKVNNVLVKEGIPFLPSFLIAFLVTLFYGDIFVWLGI